MQTAEKEKPRTRIVTQSEVMSQTLMDDSFLLVALRDRGALQYVLRKLLGMPELVLCENQTAYTLKQLKENKDVILDGWAEDAKGRGFHLEIQKQNSGDHRRRVRFYGAIVDSLLLPAGKDYAELPDSYLVYITKTDFLGTGTALCEVKRSLGGKEYDDGRHTIFVNASAEDGSEVAELMAYFRTADPNDMRFGELSERVRALKMTEGGLKELDAFAENYYNRGREEGRNEGLAEGQKQTISRMIQKHLDAGSSLEQAMSALMLSPDEKDYYRQKFAN